MIDILDSRWSGPKKETAFSCTQCEFECIRIDQLKDHINSMHGQSKEEETKPDSGAGILQDTLEMWHIEYLYSFAKDKYSNPQLIDSFS